MRRIPYYQWAKFGLWTSCEYFPQWILKPIFECKFSFAKETLRGTKTGLSNFLYWCTLYVYGNGEICWAFQKEFWGNISFAYRKLLDLDLVWPVCDWVYWNTKKVQKSIVVRSKSSDFLSENFFPHKGHLFPKHEKYFRRANIPKFATLESWTVMDARVCFLEF